MSEYSRFLSWDRSCLDRGSYGSTAGDSFWQGLRDYNQMRPCPNGMELDTRLPGECEHWRRRIEKAKRDIKKFDDDMRVLFLAESIPVEQIMKDIEELRAWAKSLQQIS